MNNYECWEIGKHTLEYFDDTHEYLVDGLLVPSITQLIKTKFGSKYNFVRKDVLEKASQRGTEVHKAIEDYCTKGIETDLKELYNFKFLQKMYNFEVIENEIPVILFMDNTPVAAGRLDLVLKINEEIGGGDIKSTSTLDKEYLAYQLNLYRLAYKQCYGIEWKFLKGVHLKDDKRKFVDIPIKEQEIINFVKEILNNEQSNS